MASSCNLLRSFELRMYFNKNVCHELMYSKITNFGILQKQAPIYEEDTPADNVFHVINDDLAGSENDPDRTTTAASD